MRPTILPNLPPVPKWKLCGCCGVAMHGILDHSIRKYCHDCGTGVTRAPLVKLRPQVKPAAVPGFVTVGYTTDDDEPPPLVA